MLRTMRGRGVAVGAEAARDGAEHRMHPLWRERTSGRRGR